MRCRTRDRNEQNVGWSGMASAVTAQKVGRWATQVEHQTKIVAPVDGAIQTEWSMF